MGVVYSTGVAVVVLTSAICGIFVRFLRRYFVVAYPLVVVVVAHIVRFG